MESGVSQISRSKFIMCPVLKRETKLNCDIIFLRLIAAQYLQVRWLAQKVPWAHLQSWHIFTRILPEASCTRWADAVEMQENAYRAFSRYYRPPWDIQRLLLSMVMFAWGVWCLWGPPEVVEECTDDEKSIHLRVRGEKRYFAMLSMQRKSLWAQQKPRVITVLW